MSITAGPATTTRNGSLRCAPPATRRLHRLAAVRHWMYERSGGRDLRAKAARVGRRQGASRRFGLLGALKTRVCPRARGFREGGEASRSRKRSRSRSALEEKGLAPASINGLDAKLKRARERYLFTVFCYGCNLGPVQTARSVRGIDRSSSRLWDRLRGRGEPPSIGSGRLTQSSRLLELGNGSAFHA